MAKAIQTRRQDALGTFRSSMTQPGLMVVPTPYYSPPRGLNTYLPISRVPPEYCVDMSNLILDQGLLASRKGFERLGNATSEVLMAVFSFVNQDGVGFLFKLTPTSMYFWNGTDWTLIGSIFSGTYRDKFTWTGWGDSVLISNGIDKIKSYNTKTGIVETLLESFPTKHLTSFNNRVIASGVLEGNYLGVRQRWSVKNDSTDWTSETTTDGIGAGFEDLTGTPGGFVDQIMGTYPLSDDTALVIRENSLWLEFVTGNVDSPHRFSRLTPEIGCRTRYSPVISPYGVIMLSLNDVVVVTTGGPESIGEVVRRSIIDSIDDVNAVCAAYDPRRQEYRLCTGEVTWRYSFPDKGWTKDVYANTFRQMSFVDYRSLGLRIGELAGTIGDLSGRIGDLVRTNFDEGIHGAASGIEVPLHETDDVTTDDGVQKGISITSSLLQAESPLARTELIEAQLEYESELEQELLFEYSYDRGQSWNQYSTTFTEVTSGSQILAVRRTLISHNLQVRVSSATLGHIKILGLYLFVVKGAKVNP